MTQRGKLITFEGCEGVGKSTQIRMLMDYMKQSNQPAICLREPGGNPISEKIRALILDPQNADMSGNCEAFLYSAARAQLIAQKIAPAIESGVTVLCDRYIDSTIAYQGYARGLGIDYIRMMNELACGAYLPDVTVFMDMEPEDAFIRKGGADANDRIEREKADFHQRVYQGYKIAAELYRERFVTVDARHSIEAIGGNVLRTLKARGIIR